MKRDAARTEDLTAHRIVTHATIQAGRAHKTDDAAHRTAQDAAHSLKHRAVLPLTQVSCAYIARSCRSSVYPIGLPEFAVKKDSDVA
ncbi:protein of unknown function [Pararobbsia alpina]